MKRTASIVSALLIAVAVGAKDVERAAPFYLFKNGQATATVVLKRVPPGDAADVVRAVDLFREDLAKFGFTLGDRIDVPFGSDFERVWSTPNRVELVVEDRTLYTEDKTIIDFPEGNVMRITGGRSGSIRALFYLLEEFGGARYLYQSADENRAYFPARKELAIPRRTIRLDSAYPLGRSTGRTVSYIGPLPRLRRYFWQWEVRLGAKMGLCGGGHPLRKIAFPIHAYRDADEKPDEEMFPMVEGRRVLPYEPDSGVRPQADWQPCYSSDAAVDEAARNLLAHLERHPATRMLSLAMNDTGGFCECDDCLAVDGKRLNSLGYPDRSRSYYQWVNRVVERICAEFPDVLFRVTPYREVFDPPPFDLHPNIVAVLALNFNAAIDPEIMEARKQLIREWAARAAHIGFSSYDCGWSRYMIPRVYFDQQKELIRYLHAHKGAVGNSSGVHYFTANEGPKVYLHFKLLENPELEVDDVLDDWCRACVGVEAAPHLRAYYAFWEDYWRTKATKTQWWDRRHGVLFNGQVFGTYMYGLEPGDMARCRGMMEKVVELAEKNGAADQTERARVQMSCFEWSEAAAKAMGAEHFLANGELSSVDAAVDLLRDVPTALKSYAGWREIPARVGGWSAWNALQQKDPGNVVAYSITAVAPFLGQEETGEALRKVADDKDLPANVRAVAARIGETYRGQAEAGLLKNGSFELQGQHGWTVKRKRELSSVTVTNEAAFHGEYALRCDIQHGNYSIHNVVSELPSKTAYLVTARIRLDGGPGSTEGTVEFWADPKLRWNQPQRHMEPGRWHYVCALVPERTDKVTIRARFARFEAGTVAYIDDVRLFAVPEGK